MSATPLTTECRAIAERMRNVSHLSGNIQVQHQMAYEDPVILQGLGDACRANAEDTLAAGVDAAVVALRNVIALEGNTGLHRKMIEGADAVAAACDFVEAIEEDGGGKARKPARKGDKA